MYGYISGYSEVDSINYCPACGEKVFKKYGDGTAQCDECGLRFGVVEVDEDED